MRAKGSEAGREKELQRECVTNQLLLMPMVIPYRRTSLIATASQEAI